MKNAFAGLETTLWREAVSLKVCQEKLPKLKCKEISSK